MFSISRRTDSLGMLGLNGTWRASFPEKTLQRMGMYETGRAAHVPAQSGVHGIVNSQNLASNFANS